MKFPQNFVWGAATAAYQIEGAVNEDGRGQSVWDTFCKQPGRVFEGHSGATACDHYHRYKEDIALMKELGIKAYRFSISWTRILPDGIGKVNDAGLKFYENLVDELIANDIVPYATLFHWDYPQALADQGGWLNPASPMWFAEYVQVVSTRLKDKLKHYITLNEPQCFIGLAHRQTVHAPGTALPLRDQLQMAHNVLLAHGRAVQMLRHTVEGCTVGYASTGTTYYPSSDSSEDIEAARQATFDIHPDWSFCIAYWSDPIFLGHYPQKAIEIFGENMPVINKGDMETICQPLDFLGHNIYESKMVCSDGGCYKTVNNPVGHPHSSLGWPVTPQGLRWAPRFLCERYKVPFFITENGMACHDTVSRDGCVHDPNRIDYLARYLSELQRAIADGVDVRGYFAWSLMDNFEWAEGYNERFGLIYVDYATQQRILKDSAYWYREVIASNAVLP